MERTLVVESRYLDCRIHIKTQLCYELAIWQKPQIPIKRQLLKFLLLLF